MIQALRNAMATGPGTLQKSDFFSHKNGAFFKMKR
jgi:hypothetical protein